MSRKKPKGGEPNRWILKSLKKSKPNFDAARDFREAPTIGLGLESTFNAERVERADVSKDQWTTYDGAKQEQPALYRAGWSLSAIEEH